MNQQTAVPPVPTDTSDDVVMLSGRGFLLACAGVAVVLLVVGRSVAFPVGLLAAEVLLAILSLFLLGSFTYQVHKNALTYGMLLVIVATFCGLETSPWHVEVAEQGWTSWLRHHVLSFEGLDDLVHADTMLFILGLTYFVSVFAQTRLLEGITFALLRKNDGAILPTVVAVTAVVAMASGVFNGVLMIGLTIRTLVIILMLAAAPTAAIRYAVMVCTTVTTICGVWLAYGEPPNLIMKANLEPYLTDGFFLRYCAPVAIATYFVVAWELRGHFGAQRIDLETMDVIDANAKDVRFLQAMRHGEVLSPVEVIEDHAADLGDSAFPVFSRVRGGESLGLALVREDIPAAVRQKVLGHFVSEEVADALDTHYVLAVAGDPKQAEEAEQAVHKVIDDSAMLRREAQRFGTLAVVPFVGLLVVHGIEPRIPLFVASFAGFFAALPGVMMLPKMRALAFRDAAQEYAEYFFLFPLFLSITLLTEAGFFEQIVSLIHAGIETLGSGHVAFVQFLGSTLLSAILDNNIVADFASRGLRNLDVAVLHLFAMAQIAGYALGGCWTHIGSAQSVVAFAFIRRDVDERFTPVQWIREMTPVILKMLVVITVLLYAESALLDWLH